MATRQEFVNKIKEIYEAHSVYIGTGNGEKLSDLTFPDIYKMEKTYGRRDDNGKSLVGSDFRRDCAFIGKQYELYGDEGMKNALAVDCSGEEVAAFRALGIIGPKEDYNCRTFLAKSQKVPLNELIPGDQVYNADVITDKLPSHMATYVGDGLVVESRGRNYGVVCRPLSAGSWKVGGRLDWFDDDIPVLKRNLKYIPGNLMRGEDVRWCQLQLQKKGFDPGKIDSIYGQKTFDAVISFQKAAGLEADGIVGPITWNKLFEE